MGKIGRKRYIAVAVALVVCISAAAVGWYGSDGIHMLGPMLHTEGAFSCWSYDPETQAVGEERTASLSGWGYAWDLPFDDAHGSGAFHGSVLREYFPQAEDQGVGLRVLDGGVMCLSCGNLNFGDEETGLDIVGVFLVYLNGQGEFLAVVPGGEGGEQPQYIVHAHSPEEVPEVFARLSQSYLGTDLGA